MGQVRDQTAFHGDVSHTRATKPRATKHGSGYPAEQLLQPTNNYRPAWQLRDALERFLVEYEQRGTMVQCCRLAGVSWATVTREAERNPDFAERFREAEQTVLERLETEAMRRAVEGTVVRSRKFWRGELVGEDVKTEYSDNLLMMLLRAKAPSTYRDNSLITINQVIKAVEGFDPAEVLGTLGGSGHNAGHNALPASSD